MLTSLLLATFLIGNAGIESAPQNSKDSVTKVKIGTYDNRSIAVAFAASKFNPVKEKLAEHQKAKAAGETRKVKELEAWGEEFQQLLHFQGFGRVPVTDLLEPVTDKVKALAKSKGLAAITMACDFSSESVEIVDITEDLINLYEPSERTLKMARDIRINKPLDLVKLSRLPAHK